MNDLVKRLSEGSHEVEVSLRPERTVTLFKEMIDRGHVLIKFTQTNGGTELGVPLGTLSHQTCAYKNARGRARHTPPASFRKWKSHSTCVGISATSDAFQDRKSVV